MYTECSQFQFIIINVESVRSPHMFLLSTLYPTFYCVSGRTKVRPFLFFCAHGAQAGIEWFVPVGARSARSGFALKGGGESTRASRAGMRPARPPRAQEGALRPLLRITPAGGCSRMPATANKFVHILWKNLFAITSRRISFAPAPGVGGWRCMAYAYCSREGDAPAGCRAGAHCAPLRRIVDSVPIPGCSGVAANPLPVVMAIGWQTEGVTYSYARSAS